MDRMRPCRDDEYGAIAAIVNDAAQVHRGAIPDECWHDPYMTQAELQAELTAGVSFWGWESDGALVGVMGSQPVRDVVLIRHAYVLATSQRRGIGGALLARLRGLPNAPDADRHLGRGELGSRLLPAA